MVACTGGGCVESPLSIYMFTDYSREYNKSDLPHTEYKISMEACTGVRGGCASIYMMTDYFREYNRSDPSHRIQDQYGGLYGRRLC